MTPEPNDTTKLDRPVFDFDHLEPSKESGAFGRVGGFHLQEELGRGGMGVVYKAWDESLRRVVAVKFIRQDRALTSGSQARFIREARAAAAVSHPNIVVVHRIDEVNGTPYIVMEFVDGSSLERQLSKGKRFSAMELLQLILQVTDGLQAAHDNGIIHRDIKPSNILVETGSGRSKISDFGLARIGSERSGDSERGTVIGTPEYMSPEQINGEATDARSDLFSLGCLIHALVTGRSPFHGKSFVDTATRILTTEPSPLSDTHAGVPVVLSTICSKLLEKNPGDRYQSAKDVSREIREVILNIQRGADVPMADTIVVQSPSQKRRWRMIYGATALAVCLLAVFLIVFFAGRKGPNLASDKHTPVRDPELHGSPRVITVSRTDSNADFRTLSGAMSEARSGDTIRVTDNRTYEVNLQIQGNRDLTIESTEQAHLIPLNVDQPVLTIANAERIVIRGFRISCPENFNAILVSESSGVRLEDLRVVAKPRETAVIQFNSCNQSPDDPPMVLTGSRIESQATGQCLWIHASDQPIWNLEISRNWFLAEGVATSVVLALKGGRVTVEQNLFDGGHVGINIELKKTSPKETGPELQLRHNTFHRLRSWIGLLTTDPRATPFTLQDNLILNCGGVEANSGQQAAVADACTIGGNVWERSANKSESETDDLLRWADVQPQINVKSRKRDAEGFLSLPDESPLRISNKDQPPRPPAGALP